MVGGQCHALATLLLGNRPATHCTGGWFEPKGWSGWAWKNLTPTRIQSSNCPVCICVCYAHLLQCRTVPVIGLPFCNFRSIHPVKYYRDFLVSFSTTLLTFSYAWDLSLREENNVHSFYQMFNLKVDRILI